MSIDVKTVLGLVIACLISWKTLADERQIAFVACPIIRDTSTVPCWLSEHEGTLYFLTIQTDITGRVHPPMLGHKVLVEGVVTDQTICGGQVLELVHLSVLPELDPSCNRMLPREDRFDLDFDPPRPPGPSTGRLDFGSLPGPSTTSPTPPFEVREFEVSFGFDGLLGVKHPQMLKPILDYALASKAREIRIVGFRGAALLSDGTIIRERASIAQERADIIAKVLRGAGLSELKFIKETANASSPRGQDDWRFRRATVYVKP